MPNQSLGPMFWILILIIYAYCAYCFQLIANKTGTPNGWFAWVPILNIFLIIFIAGKPWWWVILLLLPLVNIVVYFILLYKLAEARKKSGWLGIAMIIPILNFIILGYLAFSD